MSEKERREKAKEKARAEKEKTALEVRDSIFRLLDETVKRNNFVVMEEPDPTNIDAVTNMCRAVSRAAAMVPEKFVLVLAHSPEAAVRAFRLFYEQTTLRVYLDVEPDDDNDNDDEDDDDDGNAKYFNALYSWVKHRVVVVTPVVLKKKMDAQGPELVFQISLVVLCDAFRMKPQGEFDEDDVEPNGSVSPLIPFIDTLKLLGSKVMIRPIFLNPVDGVTTKTTAEFLWDNEANKVFLSPEEDTVVLVVQRKVRKKMLKVNNQKRIIDRRSVKSPQQQQQIKTSPSLSSSSTSLVAPSLSLSSPSKAPLIKAKGKESVKENNDDDEEEDDDDDEDEEDEEEEEEEEKLIINVDGPTPKPSGKEEMAGKDPTTERTEEEIDSLKRVDVTSYIKGGKMMKGEDYIDALIARSRKKGLKDPTFVLEDGGISIAVWDAPNEFEAAPGTLYAFKSTKKGVKKMKKEAAFCTLRYLDELEQSNDPKSKVQTYSQCNFAGRLPVHSGNKVILPDEREFTVDRPRKSKKETEKAPAQIALDTLGQERPKLSISRKQIKEVRQENEISTSIEIRDSSGKPKAKVDTNLSQLHDQPQMRQEPKLERNPQPPQEQQELQSQESRESKSLQESQQKPPHEQQESHQKPQQQSKPLQQQLPPPPPQQQQQQIYLIDYKNELQTFCQRHFNGKHPIYYGNKVILPDEREFTIDYPRKSKKETEKALAQIALEKLKLENPGSFQNPQMIPPPTTPQTMDPCNKLQTYCQRKFGGKIPEYNGNKVIMPDGKEYTTDFAGNKKDTRKALAQLVLGVLGLGPKPTPSPSLGKEAPQEGDAPSLSEQDLTEEPGGAPLSQPQPISRPSHQPLPPDSKSKLQMYCQCHFKGERPEYNGNKVILPDGKEYTTDFVGNKKETEKVLAQIALDAIEAECFKQNVPPLNLGKEALQEGDALSLTEQDSGLSLSSSITSTQTLSSSQVQASNPKNELQTYCQRVFGGKLPEYDGSSVIIPDGRKFSITYLGNKKDMEKALAQMALDKLKSENPESFQTLQKAPSSASLQTMDPCNRLQTYCQRKFGGRIPDYNGNKVILPDGKEYTTDFVGNKKETRKVLAQLVLVDLEEW